MRQHSRGCLKTHRLNPSGQEPINKNQMEAVAAYFQV